MRIRKLCVFVLTKFATNALSTGKLQFVAFFGLRGQKSFAGTLPVPFPSQAGWGLKKS